MKPNVILCAHLLFGVVVLFPLHFRLRTEKPLHITAHSLNVRNEMHDFIRALNGRMKCKYSMSDRVSIRWAQRAMEFNHRPASRLLPSVLSPVSIIRALELSLSPMNGRREIETAVTSWDTALWKRTSCKKLLKASALQWISLDKKVKHSIKITSYSVFIVYSSYMPTKTSQKIAVHSPSASYVYVFELKL